jgi:hypothetical protein
MQWRRLWQPRRGLFWMMLGFNVLSSVCGWALRALPLNMVGLLLITGVALLNVAFGLAAAWQLLNLPTAAEEAAEEAASRPPAG